MNQILRCDWLPERARWSYLARSGQPAASRKKHFPESHITNFLLSKLVQSRWLDIGLVLFCVFMDLDSVSVHKHAKKNVANIQPSLSYTWSITHTSHAEPIFIKIMGASNQRAGSRTRSKARRTNQ